MINPMDWDPLVVKISKKFGAEKPIRDSWQYSVGWAGLMKALKKFDKTRSSFMTFAYRCIQTAILNELKHMKRMKRFGTVVSFDHEPMVMDETALEDEEFAEWALSKMTPRARRLVKHRVMQGMTLVEAGRMENKYITKERVRQIIEGAFNVVRSQIT